MAAADPDDIGADVAREMLDILEGYRREVIGMILSAREPLSGSLRGLLAEIDTLIARLSRDLGNAMTRGATIAANAGDEAVLDAMRSAQVEVPLSMLGVSPQLVRVASEYAAELITRVPSVVRGQIATQVRLAALGGVPTTTLIDRIGRNLTSPSIFGTVARRAEAIARTEVSRVRSMAYEEQGAEVAQRYPGTTKVWEHASTSPGFTTFQRRSSRPNHVRISRETNANPIPFDALFDLGGGITARYPHDPSLPASEVVSCRCRLRIVLPAEVSQ